jgi:hypothetical protein
MNSGLSSGVHRLTATMLQQALGAPDQPARALQRIADDDRHAAQDGETGEPVPPSAGIGTVLNANALKQAAKDQPLAERRHDGAAEERAIPPDASALGRGTEAELEADAAEHQRQQHGDHRGIQRGQDHRVGEREHREQSAAAQHQPGLVAIPHGCDAVHHHVAILLAPFGREQDADAEVEAVEQHIGQHGNGDQARPDQREDHGTRP